LVKYTDPARPEVHGEEDYNHDSREHVVAWKQKPSQQINHNGQCPKAEEEEKCSGMGRLKAAFRIQSYIP
jgi:hypothetical protein